MGIAGRVAALLLVGVAACGAPPPEADEAPFDPAEVEAAVARYLEAIEARDTAAVRSAILDDGRFAWLENGELRYWSVDAMLESLASFGADTPIRTRTEELTVVPVGSDGARAWAGFTTMVGEGESAYTFGGMLSWVLERRDDEWLIVGGHTSSPPAP